MIGVILDDNLPENLLALVELSQQSHYPADSNWRLETKSEVLMSRLMRTFVVMLI